jgi:predicted transport protein
MKTAQETERDFLAAIVPETGADLNTWLSRIKASGLTKTPDQIKWLKEQFGLKHWQAAMLSGISKNNGNPVYADAAGMLDALFAGREALRPVYDALEARVRALFPAVQVVPAKSYVSFRAPREFACAAMKKDEVRLGLDLGDLPFTDELPAAKSLGAMPRLGHMFLLHSPQDVNARVAELLQLANQRVNSG